MKCMSCLRGFANECRGGSCSGTSTPFPDPIVLENDPTEELPDDENEADDEDKPRFRRNKPDAALKDQQSTGRKRAARLYPLDRAGTCEWWDASPDNPKGGGDKPVTLGCDRTQLARHHGPDKNTLNNDVGNVHRICHHHHNQWHAMNDPDYDPNKPLKS